MVVPLQQITRIYMNETGNTLPICVVTDIDASMLSLSPSQLSSYILLLCRQGSVTLDVNMVKMCIEAECRVCLSSVMTITPLEVSDDFRATVVVIDNELFADATLGVPAELIFNVMSRPVHRVENVGDRRLLDSLVDALRHLCNGDSTARLRRSAIANQLRALFFAIAAIGDGDDTFRQQYSTTDSYFYNFISLVFNEVNRKHDVKYYAEMLHISPKYLNDITKRKSGHKAKEIISNMLLTRIKHDILIGNKSLKALADEYNFADQSSLGKFFRNMTGLSPNNYRLAENK